MPQNPKDAPVVARPDVEAIAARCDKATMWKPEECELTIDEDGVAYAPQGAVLGDTLVVLDGTYEGSGDDWSFLAHSRRDVAQLCAYIKALELRGVAKCLGQVVVDGAKEPAAPAESEEQGGVARRAEAIRRGYIEGATKANVFHVLGRIEKAAQDLGEEHSIALDVMVREILDMPVQKAFEVASQELIRLGIASEG